MAGQLSAPGPPWRPRAIGVSVRPPQVGVGRCLLLPRMRERAAGSRVHPGLPLSCNRPNWAAPVSAAGTQTHGRGTPGTVGQGPGGGRVQQVRSAEGQGDKTTRSMCEKVSGGTRYLGQKVSVLPEPGRGSAPRGAQTH